MAAGVTDLRIQCHFHIGHDMPTWQIKVSGFVFGEYSEYHFDHVVQAGELATGISLAVQRFQGRHCKGEHL